METEGEPIGTCVRCGAVGPVGEPCGNVRCQSSKNCFLPDEYARAPATDAMLGVAIDGRYLILSLLGVGGFGRVYVARHLRTDQLVAIKQIDRADPARAAELLREARTLARLKHPNIVLLQDYGELDGRPYMVMEHVDPVIALEDALRTAPTEADRLRLLRGVLRQALDGLGYAHALGVVHRDLKPGNVLIRRLPSELLVKIVDFGLAKCLDDGRTNSRDAGTPLYMAPEQIGRRAVSPATDLYALGAMLFEEVTGQEPFDGTLADVLVQKVTPGHDPLARVPEGALAPEMRELLAASLAYEPAARPQDTDAFRAAMERAFKAQIALVEAGGGAVARAPRAVGLGSADTGVLEVPARIDPNGATMDAPGDAAGGGVLRTVTASAAAEALEAMAARPIETAPVDSATALAVERAALPPLPTPRAASDGGRAWRRVGLGAAAVAAVVAIGVAVASGGDDTPTVDPVAATPAKPKAPKRGAWSAGDPVVLPGETPPETAPEAAPDATGGAAAPDEPAAASDACKDAAGTWQLTTTVTSAKDKNAVGVTGFYGLVVGADCRFELVKTGSRGSVVSTFREGDEQRGSGVLTPAGGGRWALDAHIANADRGYDARFDLELGKVLSGTWRYTGASFEKTGYRGTVEGTRAR